MSTISINADQKFIELRDTVQLILNRIQKYQTLEVDNSSFSDNPGKVNVLNLALESATLIHAHSTKLALLISNKPFSPSTISRVLRELNTGPITGLLYAVELCNPRDYSKLMSSEMKYHSTQILAGIKSLVDTIPLNDQTPSNCSSKDLATKEKKSLIIIGTIMEKCDALKGIVKLGVVGLFISKIEGYRDLIKDAMEELQEWATEQSDAESEDEVVESLENLSSQNLKSIYFASPKHIPNDDIDGIRPRLQVTHKKLRLLILMSQAIIKRRFKILPDLPYYQQREIEQENMSYGIDMIKLLDRVLEIMKTISHLTDDLASSFYDLDVQQIDYNMKECFSAGSTVATLLLNDWNGKPDSFSDWLCNFQKGIAWVDNTGLLDENLR